MGRLTDLTGMRFGRFTVISRSHKNIRGEHYWLCKCYCGNEKIVVGNALKRGRIKSCGCLHKDAVTTHGMTKTRVFKSWESMKQRCNNPNSSDYHNYGERGITVCDKWVNSFDNFLEDMGERPKGTTLDRKDNNGNYEPSNCRWATIEEQLYNRKNTVKVLWDNSFRTIKELSEISGLKEKIIRDRLYAEWPIEKVMTTPNRKAKLN